MTWVEEFAGQRYFDRLEVARAAPPAKVMHKILTVRRPSPTVSHLVSLRLGVRRGTVSRLGAVACGVHTYAGCLTLDIGGLGFAQGMPDEMGMLKTFHPLKNAVLQEVSYLNRVAI